MGGSGRDRRAGGARSLLAGAGLLALGGALGVGIGSLVDAPRLLLRRLVEPAQRVQLPTSEPAGPASTPQPPGSDPQLREYRALQEAAPAAPARPAEPEPIPPPPPVAAAPEPKPEAPTPEELIAAIAARRGEGAPASSAPSSGERVVQVGAFADARLARQAVERLRGLGFEAYLSDTQAPGTYRHRVRVRAAGREVRELAAELERRGFGVWVTAE